MTQVRLPADATYDIGVIKPLTLAILRADPQHVVRQCQYWNYFAGCADCVIGRVLAALGLPVKEISEAEVVGCDAWGTNSTRLGGCPWASIFTEEARLFLQHVQDKQDSHHPWGEIAEMAGEQNWKPESMLEILKSAGQVGTS